MAFTDNAGSGGSDEIEAEIFCCAREGHEERDGGKEGACRGRFLST